jgi:hypothetical protein
MRSKLDILAEEVLTQLEKKENRLLNWGLLGGFFDASAEVMNILQTPPTSLLQELWEELAEQGISGDDIVKNLEERKLIFKSKKGYRSRYAETIRLLYLLKQRFKSEDWLNAPDLVSGIKSQLTYRNYPKRNVDWHEVKKTLTDLSGSSFISQVLYTLLNHGDMLLSKFQLESLATILGLSGTERDSGTIIGAGTGSGKTKSFYLPVFAEISDSIKQDNRAWTRMLGIYPRTELLKDQFKEAISENAKLRDLYDQEHVRTIRIGSYYGDTPNTAQDVIDHAQRSWDKYKDGYICPFFTCPKCDSPMLWLEADVKREIVGNGTGEYEQLTCSHCNYTVDSESIVLTRKRMESTPPDILFTTTEMLNRKLFSVKDRHIFGVHAIAPPLFVLFDEVHIYSGINGAHVAYLIRRWRHLVNVYNSRHKSIRFVGLSATLPNPQHFFSQLIGVEEHDCRYITPQALDMQDEGVEYNLVLRGDPFSATALLSTSVQTAMLLGRMLDPIHENVSNGAWGSKVFGFTDKLDVINRWYHIEKDAEEKKVLASYRDPDLIPGPLKSTAAKQRNIGQIWSMAKKIDANSLANPMKVDITSSQQKGVKADAKLVIATSTLEVGYNDTKVGAVIQHKAPRNLASFMQRKGRAGRERGMRPWTIVVTSAYGRDRFVYEFPEQLYNPQLPDLTLPVRNIYVQRIQAVYAFMDWLSCQLEEDGFKNSVWDVLTPNRDKFNRVRNVLSDILKEVLNGDDEAFKKYLGEALQLEEMELERILWTSPRGIMFEVLPKVNADLDTNWGRHLLNDSAKNKNNYAGVPLQGYIPRNLFSSLEINELMLITPKGEEQYQTLQQGMIEFAPGNVSKRYVDVQKTWQAHWVNCGDKESIDLLNGPIKGRFIKQVTKDSELVEVYLPERYQLEQIPQEVTDRSTGFLDWDILVAPYNEATGNDQGDPLALLNDSSYHDILSGIELFTSNQHQYVRLMRYVPSVKVEKRFKNGDSQKDTITFNAGKKKAAIGFEKEVDALVFYLKNIDYMQSFTEEQWEEMLQEMRPMYYFQCLKQDEVLFGTLTIFEIEWLWQICFSSTIATAVAMQISIPEAVEVYKKNRTEISKRALDAIFNITQSAVVTDEDSELNDEAKLYKRLLAYIDTDEYMEALLENIDVLYKDIRHEKLFLDWLQDRFKATVASALSYAMGNLLPDVNTEDIHIDIVDNQIWFYETDSGGMGIITNIASMIRNSPVLFEELFHHAIEHCQRNEIAEGLNVVLSHMDKSDMKETFHNIRHAVSLDEQREELKNLQKQLSDRGVTPKQELVVSVITKLLNANTNENTDRLTQHLHQLWSQEQERLNCRIDSRIFTVASLKDKNVKEQVNHILLELNPGIIPDEKQQFILIESLLWNDCKDSCPDCLNMYSPFQSFEDPSRILVHNLMKPNKQVIDTQEDKWKEKLIEVLQSKRPVRVKTLFENMEETQKALYKIIQTPVDYDFELFYPYIYGVQNIGKEWFIDVQVREVTHA